MKRSVILLTAVLFSASAWAADTPTGNSAGMSQGSTNHMSGGEMSGGSMNHMSGGMMAGGPESCQGLMDSAKPKVDAMADGAMKTNAMKEMGMAKMAMNKGHIKTCVSHMHKAMGMMH